MKNMKKYVMTAVLTMGISAIAHAGYNTEVESGKIQARETVNEIEKDVQDIAPMEKAMAQLLESTANVLRREGFNKEADRIGTEWKQMSAVYFNKSNNLLKLGDHAPLNQWLADIYNLVEGSLGQEKVSEYHLDDIKFINYGFPVVIHPSGDPSTGKAWGMQEYSEHFVPFSTAVSYWAGYFVCKKVIKSGTLANMCNSSLDTFRSTIESYIAPGVSDEIYRRFNPENPANN